VADVNLPQVRTLKNGVKTFVISNCCYDEKLKARRAKKLEEKPTTGLDASIGKINKLETQKNAKGAPMIQICVVVEVCLSCQESPFFLRLGRIGNGGRE
jgi:hypothetical protein